MVVVPLVVDLASESRLPTGGWAVLGLPWLPAVLVAPALTYIPISTCILLLTSSLGQSMGRLLGTDTTPTSYLCV